MIKFLVPMLAMVLAGCAPFIRSSPPEGAAEAKRGLGGGAIVEAYHTPFFQGLELDSLAFWSDAKSTWLIASAKKGAVLLIFDASTGALLHRIEGVNGEPFRRPNGLAVTGSSLLIVESSASRLRVLSLPDLRLQGSFGEAELQTPLGLAVAPRRLDDGFDVFVTDAVKLDASVARIKHYRLDIRGDQASAEFVRAFATSDGDGAVKEAESIAIDPRFGRLLIADEAKSERNIKVYSLDGSFTGRVLGRGILESEPEGIALDACGSSGVWIVADQLKDGTRFHLFERQSLAHLGSFATPETQNTDGITLASAAFPGFSQGALFAVHRDEAVSAFDLGAIRREFTPAPACDSRRAVRLLGLERGVGAR